MTVYDAINQMREITANNGTFSFTFISYDRDRQDSQGVIEVPRARLRPQSKEDKVENADYKLNYVDMDTGNMRNCWQPLIIEFNGEKLTL